MKAIQNILAVLSLGLLLFACKGSYQTNRAGATTFQVPTGAHFPWREAGLTERQAAAHLLDRFTYRPRPGEIDRVISTGFEYWYAEQLIGNRKN